MSNFFLNSLIRDLEPVFKKAVPFTTGFLKDYSIYRMGIMANYGHILNLRRKEEKLSPRPVFLR